MEHDHVPGLQYADGESGPRAESLCKILGDPRYRRILTTLTAADTSLTAVEVAERSDISESTAYRKLSHLHDTEFIEQDARLTDTGRTATTYSVSDIRIAIHVDEGEIDTAVDTA